MAQNNQLDGTSHSPSPSATPSPDDTLPSPRSDLTTAKRRRTRITNHNIAAPHQLAHYGPLHCPFLQLAKHLFGALMLTRNPFPTIAERQSLLEEGWKMAVQKAGTTLTLNASITKLVSAV